MKSLKVFWLCFSFLIIFKSIYSQVNINDQQDFMIKYSTEKTQHNYNNTFLAISEANKKSKQSLLLNFQIKTNIQVTLIDKKSQKISILINIESAKGDCKIKDIDLEQNIYPDDFLLSLNFLDDKSESLLKFKPKVTSKENQIRFDTIVQVSKKIFYSRPKNEILYIGQSYKQQQNCSAQIALINKYYQSPLKFSEHFNAIKQFDLSKYDMIQLYSIRFEAIKKWMTQQEELDYIQKLSLTKKDPCSFMKNMQELKSQVDHYQKELSALMTNLDDTQYQTALEALKVSDTIKAIEMLEGALRMNQKNGKALVLYTELSWLKYKNRASFQKCIEIFKTSEPATNDIPLFIEVFGNISNYYIKRGNALNAEQKTNEAIIEFTEAEYICNNFSKIYPCPKSLFNGMQTAKHGLYGSYLKVVQKAIDQKLWNMAETYVDLSCKYQRDNALYVESDAECLSLIEKMYQRFITSGDKKVKSGKYIEALEYYNNAQVFCKKYQLNYIDEIVAKIELTKKSHRDYLLNNSNQLIDKDLLKIAEASANKTASLDSLLSKSRISNELEILPTKFQEYQSLIEDGMSYRNSYRNKEAFFSFKKAKHIEQQYPIDKDGLLTVLLKETGRQYIQDEIYNVTFLVWASKTDSAQKQLNKLVELQTFCNLNDDETTMINIQRAKHEIDQRICRNLSEKFNNAIQMATNAISINRFITASDYLKIAESASNNNKTCALDSMKLKILINKISKPIQYQQTISAFRQLAADSAWDQAFYKYHEAEQLYSEYQLKNENIILDSLHLILPEYYKTNQQDKILKSIIKNQHLNAYLFKYAQRLVETKTANKQHLIRAIANDKADFDYTLNPRGNALENLKDLPSNFFGKSLFRIQYSGHLFLLKKRIVFTKN